MALQFWFLLLSVAIVSLSIFTFLTLRVRRPAESPGNRLSVTNSTNLRGGEEATPVEVDSLSGFSQTVGELIQQLHSDLALREIPGQVVRFLDRCFQAEEVIVLVRRKPSSTDPEK